jgi:hypothetical protein
MESTIVAVNGRFSTSKWRYLHRMASKKSLPQAIPLPN